MAHRVAPWRSVVLVLIATLTAVVVASARAGGDGITDTIGGGVLIDGSALKIGVYGNNPGMIGARFAGNPVSLFYYDDNGLNGGGGAALGIHWNGAVAGFTGTSAPALTGTGTSTDPWIVTSSWTVDGTPLTITQRVRNVDGAHSYRVAWTVANTSGSATTFSAFNGVDLYVQGSDAGVGIFDSGPPRFVAGRAADGTTVGITEVTPWSHYFEGDYGSAIGPLYNAGSSYNDSTDPTSVDNGVAVSWEDVSLAAGASTTITVGWGFVSAGGAAVPAHAPTIDSAPLGASGSFSFSAHAGDVVAGFECSIDGAAFDPCTSPFAYSGLASGSHTYTVHEANADGDAGPNASGSWVVAATDTTPPSVPTVSSQPAHTTATSASFTFSGEPGGSYDCRLDGGTWTSSCSSPTSYPLLGVGAHTFDVRQRDAAANVGVAAHVAWSVDAPATTEPEPDAPAVGPAPEAPTISVIPAQTVVTAGNRPPVGAATFSSHTVELHVTAGTTYVLVSQSSDLADAQLVPVGSDGTIHVTLPDSVEGSVQLWVAQPNGQALTSTTVTIDTVRPRLLSVVPARAVRAHKASRTLQAGAPLARYWLRIVGADAETGLSSLQISPAPGVVWRWRSILTSFSVNTSTRQLRVRVADGAGNTSAWLTVRLRHVKGR